MRWLKTYEQHNDSLDGSIYPLFFYNSRGDDGYKKGETILKDEVIEKINKFNNIFKYIGICISMPIKEGQSPYYRSGENFIFNVNINLAYAKPPGQPDTFNTIFYKALEYYVKKIGLSTVSSASLITNVTKMLVEFKVNFGINSEDLAPHLHSSSSNTKNNQTKITFERRIKKHTYDNFIQIISGCLYSYLSNNKTEHVHINIGGPGNTFTTIEKYFFVKTIIKCLSEWNTLTKERIAEIFFEQIGNYSDSHAILELMKDTEWYPIFQRIDNSGLNTSSNITDMGFSD